MVMSIGSSAKDNTRKWNRNKFRFRFRYVPISVKGSISVLSFRFGIKYQILSLSCFFGSTILAR